MTSPRARVLACTVGFCVAFLGALAGKGALAQQWDQIVQRSGYTGAAAELRGRFDSASTKSGGFVSIEIEGRPDDQLVAAIATTFAPSARRFPTGHTLDRVVFETCGYVSEEYRNRVWLANEGKFVDGVLAGLKGQHVSLRMPACLAVVDYLRYNVQPGESAANLADSISKRPYDRAYCAELEKVNYFDVCNLSERRELKPDVKLWLPRPSDGTPRKWAGLLRLAQEKNDDNSEALANWIAISVNRAAATGETDLQRPQVNPVVPDQTPKAIVPTATCNESLPPFQFGRTVDALVRAAKAVSIGEIRYSQSVKVGIVDTGLYGSVRESFFERVPVVNAPGYIVDSQGKWFRSLIADAHSYPADNDDVAPEVGGFADHGTHVAGLVVGGGDLWSALRAKKFDDALIPNYIGTYIAEVLPIKIMAAREGSTTPKAEPGDLKSALSFLMGASRGVSIINLSSAMRGAPSLKEEFERYRASGVIFVAAAGNDYDESLDNNLDGNGEGANSVVPAMLSNSREKYFITVGAMQTDTAGSPAKFSQRSSKFVDLFAPGTCIRSFGERNPLTADVAYSGTSQAAPLVSFAASILLRFGVRIENVKMRLLSTVDPSEELAGISISGGYLNLAKALDYRDDIVAFDKTPEGAKAAPGDYRRGTLYYSLNGNPMPGYFSRLCKKDNAKENLDPEAGFRKLRRVVRVEGDTIKWASALSGEFSYTNCKFNADLEFRLVASDGMPDVKFKLTEVREIVPRPEWFMPVKK